MKTRSSFKVLGMMAALLCLAPVAANAVPVEWGSVIVENTTGYSNSIFTGAPDGEANGIAGLGLGRVTYDFGTVVNIAGADFNVYENSIAGGGNEINLLDVYVGVGTSFSTAVWYFVDDSRGPGLLMDGFETYPSSLVYSFAIPEILPVINYIRLVGTGTGGRTDRFAGYDLNAVGVDPPAAVPEPGTLLLLGTGLLGLGLMRKRRA